jgi:hypothetical protein
MEAAAHPRGRGCGRARFTFYPGAQQQRLRREQAGAKHSHAKAAKNPTDGLLRQFPAEDFLLDPAQGQCRLGSALVPAGDVFVGAVPPSPVAETEAEVSGRDVGVTALCETEDGLSGWGAGWCRPSCHTIP